MPKNGAGGNPIPLFPAEHILGLLPCPLCGDLGRLADNRTAITETGCTLE